MPLTERQQSALGVIEWLLNPNYRAEGRTMAIAVATIRVAAQRPGQAIEFFGHEPYGIRTNLTHRTIADLLSTDALIRPHAQLTQRTLTVHRAFSNWLPNEAALQRQLPALQMGRRAGERLTQMNIEVPEGSINDAMRAAIEQSIRQTFERVFPGAEATVLLQQFQAQQQADGDRARREEAERLRMSMMLETVDDTHIPQEVLPLPAPAPPAAPLVGAEMAMKRMTKFKAPSRPKAPKPRSVWERLLDEKDDD